MNRNLSATLSRRDVLSTWGLLLALVLQDAHARDAIAFNAQDVRSALQACGIADITPSDAVVLDAPDFEENGSVVSVRLACKLPGVSRMLLLVEDNPVVLSAQFLLKGRVAADFVTRIRMAQSSAVVAVAVLADGRAFYARKSVTVIQGGCGG